MNVMHAMIRGASPKENELSQASGWPNPRYSRATAHRRLARQRTISSLMVFGISCPPCIRGIQRASSRGAHGSSISRDGSSGTPCTTFLKHQNHEHKIQILDTNIRRASNRDPLRKATIQMAPRRDSFRISSRMPWGNRRAVRLAWGRDVLRTREGAS